MVDTDLLPSWTLHNDNHGVNVHHDHDYHRVVSKRAIGRCRCPPWSWLPPCSIQESNRTDYKHVTLSSWWIWRQKRKRRRWTSCSGTWGCWRGRTSIASRWRSLSGISISHTSLFLVSNIKNFLRHTLFFGGGGGQGRCSCPIPKYLAASSNFR